MVSIDCLINLKIIVTKADYMYLPSVTVLIIPKSSMLYVVEQKHRKYLLCPSEINCAPVLKKAGL